VRNELAPTSINLGRRSLRLGQPTANSRSAIFGSFQERGTHHLDLHLGRRRASGILVTPLQVNISLLRLMLSLTSIILQ